jgi:hypothetical protein
VPARPFGPGLSAVDATRAYVDAARRAEALFVALAAASAAAPDAATKIRLATDSRLVGLHAVQWHSLVPESVLLAPVVEHALREPLEPVTDAQLAQAQYLDAVAALEQRLSPVADGAGRRLASRVRGELSARPI